MVHYFKKVKLKIVNCLFLTGYIKEDNQADLRLRRRTPYLATFSPKAKP